ncbi:MAG: ATP-binding cassette domain-containing protein [Clostridia bacterium]
MSVIKVENLNKTYKTRMVSKGLSGGFKGLFENKYAYKKAVDDISFSIEKGEKVGYIGPNGAGKSTTIKMLTGILTPTSGDIMVSGLVPYKKRKENAKHIGVVFGQRSQLMWDLPLEESFDMQRYIFDVSKNDYIDRLSFFRKTFELDEFLRKPVRQLSLGQRMRAEVCLSLIHNPDIVFLDEPTIGLDVVSKETIRDLVNNMNKNNGTTFILTTHDMQDIEKTCDRVMIIDKGKLMYDDNIETLKEKFGNNKSITIVLEDMAEKDKSIYEQEGLKIEYIDKNKITYRLLGSIPVEQIIATLFSKLKIKDISISNDSVEDIVKTLYV